MTRYLTALAAASLAFSAPAAAQDAPGGAPSPGEIVAQAKAEEWVAIPADDLLVITLAPDRDGKPRKVVIQLMPAPFSQGWVENIRTLARAGWYDGISVNRVQDNYVVQWGDPNGDDDAKAKPLPAGLKVMGEEDYALDNPIIQQPNATALILPRPSKLNLSDAYAPAVRFWKGWPLGISSKQPHMKPIMTLNDEGKARPVRAGEFVETRYWPIHCYGMVGVGRNYSPDTGSGAELYTVIGHAPRHLDRNIALVGRIIEGMEHLSSLPRGSGPLGFYTEDEFAKRTPILSVRVASDLPGTEQPAFTYLSTESETFARYAEARANRRDPFFIKPAGGADICNIPVPVQRAAAD